MELKYEKIESITPDDIVGLTTDGEVVGGTINVYQLETGQEWSVRVDCLMEKDDITCLARRGDEGITCGAKNIKTDGSEYYRHIYCSKSRRIIEFFRMLEKLQG